MRTGQDQVNIVFDHLKTTDLRAAITGVMTKNTRVTNSTKEDIVINPLATMNTQLQKGIVNVNIHVPNLTTNLSGGGMDQSTPNHNRINQLTNLAIPHLKDQWGPDWDFDIEQIILIKEDKSSFNNIRIVFQSLNV